MTHGVSGAAPVSPSPWSLASLPVFTEHGTERPRARAAVHPPGRRGRVGPWLFPLLLLTAVLIGTVAGVSGTSSAVLTTGPTSVLPGDHPPLAGTPRLIRGDEWWVNTPLVVAQSRSGLPRYSRGLAGGEDMSVVFDVPYRDWSMLFRPQNWVFFLLPLQPAFAFKWWLLGALLALSVYVWTLTVCPGRRWFAALLGLAAALSPYVQWWYQTSTLASLFYAFFLMAAFDRLLIARSGRAVAGWTVLIAWLGGCFALVQYPPFQVPCALLVVAFCLGRLAMQVRRTAVRALAVRAGLAVLAAAAATGVAAIFVLTRLDVIRTIADTVYPGRRTSPSGGMVWPRILSGYLDVRLLDPGALAGLGENQSEASAFVLAGLFLAPVALLLVVRGVRRGVVVNWALLAVVALGGLLTAYCLVPGLDAVGRITGLSLVPSARLSLGLGAVAVALTVLVVGELDRQGYVGALWLAAAVGLLAFGVELAAGLRIRAAGSAFPLLLMVPLAALVGLVVATAVRRRAIASAALLLLLSAYAGGRVNPLQDGVPVLADTPIGQAVATADRADPGGWALVMDPAVPDPASLPVLVEAGVHTYSAAFGYPPLGVWRRLDPTGAYDRVYNRYATVVFTTEPAADLFSAAAPDRVVVRLDSCGTFAQTNLRHVLTMSPQRNRCLRLRSAPMGGDRRAYIYDLVQPGAQP